VDCIFAVLSLTLPFSFTFILKILLKLTLMVRKILLSLIAVLGLCVYGFAQNRQVSGKVADAEGKPVAGATVMVDGTSTGTTTGTDGKFTIAAPADATLAVSFIGYETRKVAVAGKTHVEVVMHEDAQAIENVVVTAFGTTTKKDLTGSIATIRGEELAKRQAADKLHLRILGGIGAVLVQNSCCRRILQNVLYLAVERKCHESNLLFLWISTSILEKPSGKRNPANWRISDAVIRLNCGADSFLPQRIFSI
jgi:hypothetical protein